MSSEHSPQTATPADPAVAEFAAQAVEYVRRAVGVEIEYDSDTLPLVDHYLATVPAEKPETTALIIAATGAYFGEVVRRHIGGRWEIGEDPQTWRLIMPVGLSFVPAAVVLAAIVREDAADAEFDVPAVLRPFAEAALERMGEVTESEYYSLCGRLDTLEHLHAVLVGAMAAAKAKKDADGGELN